MDNKQQQKNMGSTLQLGDLVRHKHLGGVGIILEKKSIYSNITMGLATKFIVKWLVRGTYHHGGNDYFPAFLERVDQTVKNCPPKQQK